MALVPKIFTYLSVFIPYVLVVAGLTIAGVALHSLLSSTETLECFCPSCPATAFSQKGVATLGLIKVDIQGAVVKPGIYQLEIGQRMADLIALAGGFSQDADQAYVAQTLNLATELNDQDKIYIPFLVENQTSSSNIASTDTSTSTSNAASSITTVDNNNSNSNVVNTSGPTVTTSLISINQAENASLQTLPGIGEARAKAIILNRPYTSLEELVSKEVLSENLFNDLKSQLSL